MILVTIAEAVILSNRKKSALYAWIAAGKLQAFDADGVRKVDMNEVTRLTQETKLGRPHGTAKPGATRGART